MKNNRDIRVILKRMKKMNKSLFINTILIVAVSLFSVFSATYQKTYGFFYRELVWTGIGLGVYLVFLFSITEIMPSIPRSYIFLI